MVLPYSISFIALADRGSAGWFSMTRCRLLACHWVLRQSQQFRCTFVLPCQASNSLASCYPRYISDHVIFLISSAFLYEYLFIFFVLFSFCSPYIFSTLIFSFCIYRVVVFSHFFVHVFILYHLSFRFCVLFSVFAIFSFFVFSFFSHFVPFFSFLSSLVWLVWNAFCRLSCPVRLASHSLISYSSTPLPLCFVVCDHKVLCWSIREK